MQARRASDIAGERIRLARERRNWSQQDLARQCAEAGAPELTAQVIGTVERGSRHRGRERHRLITAEELVIFAEVLTVPVVWLIAPLDGPDSLAVTPDRVMESFQAIPWLAGDSEVPPAPWLTTRSPGDLDSWRQARTELSLVRFYLDGVGTLWRLLQAGQADSAEMREAIRAASRLAELIRARGMTPPPAPDDVAKLIAAAFDDIPGGAL